jgi:hypothetical protein
LPGDDGTAPHPHPPHFPALRKFGPLKALIPVTKLQLSCLASASGDDPGNVDLDQIAPRQTMFLGFASFREIPHEPGH